MRDGVEALRTVRAEVALAVREAGPADAPAILLLHGYPDTSRVWDEVASRLALRYRVAALDLPGAGASEAPAGADGYRLERLAGCLAAALDAVSPDRPVHLVGHDWGSILGWEAVTTPALARRIASFTAVAGPCLDHAALWARRLRRADLRALGLLARQGLASWYTGLFRVPALPEALWRAGARRFADYLRLVEGVSPREGHPAPTLEGDARRGLALYRVNLPRLRNPRERRTMVPVQVVAPRHDRYVTPALAADGARWAARAWVRRPAAGHWVMRTHPDALARWVAELVDHVEGGPEPRTLRRARAGLRRRPFEDRLVVVTGAGSGIGRATALAFAARGAQVVAVDVDGAAAARTAELAGLVGGAGHAAEADVADAERMDRLAKDVLAEHGAPDVLVLNAGVGLGGPLLATGLEDWQRVLDVNLWGVINGIRAFVRAMVEGAEGGSVVAVASAAAFFPSRALPAYATSKAAVLMLAECLRAEVAGAGIGVTCVCPGLVDTPIVRTARLVGVADPAEEERFRRFAERLFARRGLPPERVAEAIVRAVRENPAVLPVGPDARALRVLSRLWPSALRALGRLDLRPRR